MKKIVLTFMGIMLAIIVNSQVSQDSALTILRNHIINYDNYDIYKIDDAIGLNDTILLLDSEIILPTQDNCWLFFVDEMPFANWSHPCKYVFVNITSGAYDIINSFSPPLNKSLIAIKTIPRTESSDKDLFRIEKQRTQNTLENNYAVIISGGANRNNNFVRYWNDCATIYSILVNKYGYDRDKIYVIMSDGTSNGLDRCLLNGTYDSSPLDLDGDGLDDIQYAATKTNISNVFNSLSNIISSDDEVFIFTTDHGGPGSTLNLWGESMTKYEFAAEVNKINNAKAINILMEQCYSGGFTSVLCGDNRVVMTACSNTESSYSMNNGLYDEFCYHWFCAVNGATPSGTIINADSNGDGYVSMEEAYNYAVYADTQTETPQYCSNGCQQQGSTYALDGIIPIHISTNTTWNTAFNVYNDIIVDEGKILTITNTIRLASDVKIVIRPSGKLVVDGGTITSLCPGKMWRSIRVVGNKNLSQLTQYQGTLEVKNGSLIENAKTAISTWDGEHYSTSGGIVKCTNSTFLNNRRSAEFMAYINHDSNNEECNNVSYFKNCNFTIDDNNIFTAAGVTYSDVITMWGVNGVAIRGCHFSDIRTGSPTRGNAITLASAGAYIKPSCTYGDYTINFPCFCTGESNNTFSGFAKGVNAENTGTNYPFKVFKANFENCRMSVYSNAVNNYNVTLSDFNMNCSSIFSDPCGIYSEYSTGYKIEGNDFYTTYTSNPSGFMSGGVLIDNSGTDVNSIYRNTFDKLSIGVLSATNNSSLQVLCNEFGNSFIVDVWTTLSISPTQGTSTESAGNKFSTGCYNFVSENSNITYYHSGANNSTNDYCPYNSINVTKIPNITANDCEPTICLLPTPIDPPIVGPILGKSAPANDDISLYESLQQIYDSRLAEYNNAGYGFLLENFEENDADIVALARLKQDTLISIHRAMAEIANRNIDAIFEDTVVFDRESLNGWYNRINTTTAKYSLVNSYFEVGNYDLARQELASIPQRFVLSNDELAEYDNFCHYQSLRESVYSSGRNYAQLTEDEIAELQTIVERNTGVSSAYANSVLCFFYGICRDEEIDIDFGIDAPMNSKSTMAVSEESVDSENIAIYVYPNPADEELNILLNVIPEGKTMIEFHDVAGRLVLSEEIKGNSTSINISSLKQGVYMYRIINGDNIIARDRIVKE